MTARPGPAAHPKPMIVPVPQPGQLGPAGLPRAPHRGQRHREEQKALGNHALLPRPWEPATCLDPELRHELWEWLEEVVIWLNHEYTWDVSGLIPHLLARAPAPGPRDRGARRPAPPRRAGHDQRRARGVAPLLPARRSLDRMRNRLRAHCDDEHARWPGRPRHNEYTATPTRSAERTPSPATSTRCPKARSVAKQPLKAPRLGLIDLETGEVISDGPDERFPRTLTTKGPRE